jgi:hypothetical protein
MVVAVTEVSMVNVQVRERCPDAQPHLADRGVVWCMARRSKSRDLIGSLGARERSYRGVRIVPVLCGDVLQNCGLVPLTRTGLAKHLSHPSSQPAYTVTGNGSHMTRQQ